MSSMGRRKAITAEEFANGCLMMIGLAIAVTIVILAFGMIIYTIMDWDWSPPRPLTDSEFVECLRQHERDFCSTQTVDPWP